MKRFQEVVEETKHSNYAEIVTRWKLLPAFQFLHLPGNISLDTPLSTARTSWKGCIGSMEVAVKVYQGLSDGQAEQLMRTVAQLAATTSNCSNVVPYLAAQHAPPDQVYVVSQLFSSSLAQLLHNQTVALPRSSTSTNSAVYRIAGSELVHHSPQGLPLPQALALATDIARGLAQLHACGVSAGTLRPANVLLDSAGVAHVGGYGFPVRAAALQGALTSRAVVDNTRYVAPELLAQQVQEMVGQLGGGSAELLPSPAADVWAYGCLLLHMLTGCPPWQGLPLLQVCKKVVEQGQCPDVPAHLPAALKALLAACFQQQPEARPSAEHLLQRLQALELPEPDITPAAPPPSPLEPASPLSPASSASHVSQASAATTAGSTPGPLAAAHRAALLQPPPAAVPAAAEAAAAAAPRTFAPVPRPYIAPAAVIPPPPPPTAAAAAAAAACDRSSSSLSSLVRPGDDGDADSEAAAGLGLCPHSAWQEVQPHHRPAAAAPAAAPAPAAAVLPRDGSPRGVIETPLLRRTCTPTHQQQQQQQPGQLHSTTTVAAEPEEEPSELSAMELSSSASSSLPISLSCEPLPLLGAAAEHLAAASMLMGQGELPAAEQKLREGIQLQQAALPPHDEAVCASVQRLAACLAQQRKWQQAADLLGGHVPAVEASAAAAARPTGQPPPSRRQQQQLAERLGQLRVALGQALLELGRPGDALAAVEPLLNHKGAATGPGQPPPQLQQPRFQQHTVAHAQVVAGRAALATGQSEAAHQALRRAYDVLASLLRPNNPAIAELLALLAESARASGRRHELLGLSITALQRHEAAFGARDLRTCRCRAALARLRMQLEQPAEAAELLAACLDVAEQRSALGKSSLEACELAELRQLQARALWRLGRVEEAIDAQQQALGALQALHPARSPALVEATRVMAAYVQHEQRRPKEAEAWLRRLLALLLHERGAADADSDDDGSDGGSDGGSRASEVADVKAQLAACLSQQGKSEEALPLRLAALAQLQRELPPGHPQLARLLVATGRDLHACRRHLDSERYCRQGLAMLSAPKCGAPREEQARATWLLAQVLFAQGRAEEAAPLAKQAKKLVAGGGLQQLTACLEVVPAAAAAAGGTPRAGARSPAAGAGAAAEERSAVGGAVGGGWRALQGRLAHLLGGGALRQEQQQQQQQQQQQGGSMQRQHSELAPAASADSETSIEKYINAAAPPAAAAAAAGPAQLASTSAPAAPALLRSISLPAAAVEQQQAAAEPPPAEQQQQPPVLPATSPGAAAPGRPSQAGASRQGSATAGAPAAVLWHEANAAVSAAAAAAMAQRQAAKEAAAAAAAPAEHTAPPAAPAPGAPAAAAPRAGPARRPSQLVPKFIAALMAPGEQAAAAAASAQAPGSSRAPKQQQQQQAADLTDFAPLRSSLPALKSNRMGMSSTAARAASPAPAPAPAEITPAPAPVADASKGGRAAAQQGLSAGGGGSGGGRDQSGSSSMGPGSKSEDAPAAAGGGVPTSSMVAGNVGEACSVAGDVDDVRVVVDAS